MIPGLCQGCKWWRSTTDSNVRPAESKHLGQCRALPPAVKPDGNAVWPTVRRDEWCGSFEAPTRII